MTKTRNDTLFITQTVHSRLPRLPFFDMKEAVLGKKYILSLVFIGDTLSQRLNRQYRKKNSPANILSFPLAKDEGEIFININRAHAEARRAHTSYTVYIAHLFIHGLVHLKGYAHSSTMEREEEKMRKKFHIA